MKLTKLLTKIIEMVKYGLVGIISTLINLLVFWLLNRVGIYYIAANILSYLLAVFLNFVLNKLFVFQTSARQEEHLLMKQGLRFSLVRVINLFVDNFLFYLFVSIVHFPLYPTRIILTLVGILITFAINKKWVFKL